MNKKKNIKNDYIECPKPIVKTIINTKNGIIFFKIFPKIYIYTATSVNNRSQRSLTRQITN
jgi:hypothetical protein